MSWERWLGERPIAVIATASPDGMPHAVPVEVVVGGGTVYTWGRGTSARLRNVLANQRAALVAYKGDAYVMVRGPVRLLTADDPEYARTTALFLSKYQREETYGNDVLIAIEPVTVVSRGID